MECYGLSFDWNVRITHCNFSCFLENLKWPLLAYHKFWKDVVLSVIFFPLNDTLYSYTRTLVLKLAVGVSNEKSKKESLSLSSRITCKTLIYEFWLFFFIHSHKQRSIRLYFDTSSTQTKTFINEFTTDSLFHHTRYTVDVFICESAYKPHGDIKFAAELSNNMNK